jgi:hypothetical protein
MMQRESYISTRDSKSNFSSLNIIYLILDRSWLKFNSLDSFEGNMQDLYSVVFRLGQVASSI